ncbi:hypothetical protein KC660_03605, partial [Candidatus Dojkabacteria bacterium]|nr:hypothetical protein [Candidatus Dojkabacteria bacterium]
MLPELSNNEFYINEKPNVTELLEENFADCLEGVATDTESWIHQMLVEFIGQEDFDKMISLLEYDEEDKDKIDPSSLENLNSRA